VSEAGILQEASGELFELISQRIEEGGLGIATATPGR
jgi:hypothetical protein